MTDLPQPASRRVIVLGALSAIAEATCRLLAEEGADLGLLARDERRLAVLANDLVLRGAGRVATRSMDLSQVKDPARVLEDITTELGGADAVLIFYGLLGDQEQANADLTAAREILAVNFTSQAEWALASANHLTQHPAGRGVLLAISSVAGDRGRMRNFVYGAAKSGLSTLMQGLAHRSAHEGGPRVVVIKMGPVDTPMTATHEKNTGLFAQPNEVARTIVKAIKRGGPVLYVPWFWRWIMLAVRAIPSPIFHRLKF
jgi:decaprenylphospho-beta-D-erythro-pentofuranosid-2-ulose 2-reductase